VRRRKEKTVVEGGRVAFEALAGRQGGEGIFGIEDEADELARQTKLRRMAERIAGYDRGYEGKQRRCPRCGQVQRYKGDVSRDVVVDGGTLTVQRAYYYCSACGQTNYPLDERLGLGEEQEQGRLREKLALVAVRVPYHQAPQVCQTFREVNGMRPVSGASRCRKPNG
jgi:uncharacterized C2H2 Zn-finger protein